MKFAGFLLSAVTSLVMIMQPGTCAAGTVYARAKIAALGAVAGEDNPACEPSAYAKNVGDQIVQKGLDAVGKATASLGLGDDPFNTRRLNKSVCMDLCVVIPTGASFTANGSIAGSYPWQGPLPAGLPGLVKPENWAAIQGPAVDSTPKGDVVCYTFKNWSDNLERNIGIEVKY